MKINWENEKLQNGVSGIMRVKNDSEFIESSIDSCIDALDELVIVYNDCSDNTPELIERKCLQYPQKIRVFEYKYKVYGANLTEEEYKTAKSLPKDSPHLLCNYYNFALSKVRYQYAIKIDADQIYFSERLKEVCDICRIDCNQRKDFKYYIGCCYNFYYRAYRYMCVRFKREFPILFPEWIARKCWSSYRAFSIHQFKEGEACISLSGINIFYDDDWYVSLGGLGDTINILPPFNGENDHILFKVTPTLYYKTFETEYYNTLRSTRFSLIEEFVHPYSYQYYGFCWYHLNAMRGNCKEYVKKEKQEQPSRFVSLLHFEKMPHSLIRNISDKKVYSLYQRIMFSLIFPADRTNISKHAHHLYTLR